jgi:hypothetical protein
MLINLTIQRQNIEMVKDMRLARLIIKGALNTEMGMRGNVVYNNVGENKL